MSKSFNKDRRNHDRSARLEKRVARVVSCFAPDESDDLFVALELEAQAGLESPWMLIQVTVPEGSDEALWALEFHDDSTLETPEKLLETYSAETVLLEPEDVKCLRLIVARINRFFHANFFVETPDTWVDAEDTGKEARDGE